MRLISWLVLSCTFVSAVSMAEDSPPIAEAKKMLGTVPAMLTLLPEAMVAPAWDEFKNLQLSQSTAIPVKYKELIGVAVAAQIPCHYCSYFHSKATTELAKGSEAEVREAIAIAGLTRQWSTVFSGLNQTPQAFKKDLDRMNKASQKNMAMKAESEEMEEYAISSGDIVSGTTSEAQSIPVVKNAEEVYREAKKMWGFVPEFIKAFPKHSVAAAWNEYGALYMNEKAAIPPKYKNLISLAVAAQTPCSYCVMMDKDSAKHAGATTEEIDEAIAMAGQTRKWSTVLNGNMVDEDEFKKQTDQIIAFVKAQSEKPEVRSSTTREAE